jgi:hypothetical protein
MTAQQKNIIILLVVINALIFCLGLPAVLIFTDVGGIQSTLLALAPVPVPTATRAPTAAPTRPAPTATLEPDWKLYTVPASNFDIAIPPTWEAAIFSPATLSAEIEKLAQKNPQLAASLRAQAPDALAKIRFMSYEPDPTFAANVTVIQDVETSDMKLEQLVDLAVKDLDKASIKYTKRTLTGLVGNLIEVKYSLPMKLNNNQTTTLFFQQYIALRGKDSYVITCTMAERQTGKIAPLCEKIALGFRWIK